MYDWLVDYTYFFKLKIQNYYIISLKKLDIILKLRYNQYKISVNLINNFKGGNKNGNIKEYINWY